MAIAPRQFGSLFELQFPQSVGIYSTYEDAQKAVDFLADSKFEVQNLAIVGTDLKSVERVLGRTQLGHCDYSGLAVRHLHRASRRLGDVDLHSTRKHLAAVAGLAGDRHGARHWIQCCGVRDEPRAA